jgi:hypothetical protein
MALKVEIRDRRGWRARDVDERKLNRLGECLARQSKLSVPSEGALHPVLRTSSQAHDLANLLRVDCLITTG